ncbi:DNA repair protein rad52, partial [Ascosphaera aggregata]
MSSNNLGESAQQRARSWSPEEVEALQNRLTTRLGPEYLSTRPGPGGQKVCYLTGPTVINLANEVFGFNGWSSSIQNISIDEDLGYGHCENMKDRYQAFEKARKEGVTDGLKRALRTFGNVLGNGLYEKDYQDALKRTKSHRVKLDGNTFKRMDDPREGLLSRSNSMNDPPLAAVEAEAEAAIKRGPTPEPVLQPAAAPQTAPSRNQGNMPTAPQLPRNQTGDVDDIMDIEFDDDAEFGSMSMFQEFRHLLKLTLLSGDLFEEAADFGDPIMALDPEEEGTTAQMEFKQQSRPLPDSRAQPRPNFAHSNTNQFITPSKPPAHPRPPGRGMNHSGLQQENSMMIEAPLHCLHDSALTEMAGSLNRPASTDSEQAPVSKTVSTTSDLPPPLPGDRLAKPVCTPDNDQVPTNLCEIPEEKRPQDPVGGFYSARAADLLRANPYAASKAAPAFDPRFDSPSIRKTAGFDHNTTAPVSREGYRVVKPQVQGPKLSQSVNTPVGVRKGTPTPGGLGAGSRAPLTTSYKSPTRRPMARMDSVLSNVSGQSSGQ